LGKTIIMDNNLTWQNNKVTKEQRVEIKANKPCVIWFTGLSGSGKSTIANALEEALNFRKCHTYLLDGDNIRMGLNKNLGFTNEDRKENIRRIAEASKLFVDAGIIVICAFISPFKEERELARSLVEKSEFIEVFVDTPLSICIERDPKGLYKKALNGEIKNFTGLDSEYQRPENPEITLKSQSEKIEDSVGRIMEVLKDRKIIGS
jgi:adenylyl-sulfate kinase